MQLLKQGFENKSVTFNKSPFDIEGIKQRFFKDKKAIRLTCPFHGLEYETFDESENLCPLCLEELENQERQKWEVDRILDKIDGLPKRYKYAGFKNYKVTPESEAAYKTVLAFAKEPTNKWLVLLGNNGTGKTHLAHAVLKVTGGIYRDFDDIAIDILDAQAGFGEGQNAVLNKYSFCPMLVVDEVDKVKKTDGRIGWLNIILRRRYSELLPVILCGNIDLETLCKHIDLNGGRAMRDRIEEVGQVVLFNWESYRPEIRSM
ncbi:ATP-binding protein [Treponema pedis]|uniref:ATP-binding protein n=1 Tax=Treponema pedis TaxID=409322 RepID=UPI003D215908